MAKAKLGSGARFKAVEASARASGARNPAAVAAAEGIKKYGEHKMATMAAAGRRSKRGSGELDMHGNNVVAQYDHHTVHSSATWEDMTPPKPGRFS